MKRISSAANPLVKRLRELAQSAKARRQQGQTLLDGTHLLQAALEADWPLLELIVSESGIRRAEIATLIDRCPDVPRTCIDDPVFSRISPVDTPSGVLAVIELPAETAAFAPKGSLLVLEGIQDPGNLGTILRTAAAVGLDKVLLAPGCTQAWSPRALRAGMGGHFSLKIRENIDVAEALANYEGSILATAVGSDARSLYEYDLRGPVAWLFGGEGAGLSMGLGAIASAQVRIPMPGKIESLNVAASVAVCLYEQLRQTQIV